MTRTQWLDAGIARFGAAGRAGLKVEAMARQLGSSKAGFYWYFKSRQAFERELFEHWRQAETKQIIAAAQTAPTPKARLALLFDRVIHLRGGADFLFHLRRLGKTRPTAAKLIGEVEAERIGYLSLVLQELGKPADEAERLAEGVYHLYLGWYERNQFEPTSRGEAGRQLQVLSALTGIELEPKKRGART